MSAKELLIQLFALPKGEIIFQDYSCALKSLISKYGRIFIAENHICFYANLAGSKINLVFKVNDIQRIESKNKNDIEITLNNNKVYCFTSFQNKDHVFNFMNSLLQGQPLSTFSDSQVNTESSNNDQSIIDNTDVEIQFLKSESSTDQEICKFTFPFSLDKFFDFFIADNASLYSVYDHRQNEKDTDMNITKWTVNEDIQDMYQREMKHVMKLTGVPFKDKTRMHKLFTYKRDQQKLIYTCTTHTLDVPYGNCFQAEEKWEVTQPEDNKCLLRVFVSVVFTKSTIMKNTIISRTMAGYKEDYEKWINNVKIRLEAQAKQSKLSVSYSTHEYEESMKLDNENIFSKILKNSNSDLSNQKEKSGLPSIVIQKEACFVLLITIMIIIMLIQIGMMSNQSTRLEQLEQILLQNQQQRFQLLNDQL
ncbi:unnamed protein product [Paramecium pentaurelia]|uniref:VASt domain-containing protein n=1 Tax=Paramecium pentaurelia TaxID=43138 RepID=A0A8S1TYF6_9CILI|nr:unnamed protein product [Paramecium pentaurelia]